MSQCGLAGSSGATGAESQLHAALADLHHAAGPGFDHRHWHRGAILREHPGHPELAADQSHAHWLLDLDLNVHAGRQVELGQRVHGLRAGVVDVHQPLVGAQLELLTALLVHVRAPEHRPALRFHRQRDGTRHLGPRLLGRPDDIGRGLIEHHVVEGLQPNSDSLCHVCSPSYLRILVTTPAPTVRPPSRMANRSPSSIAIGVISSIVICTLSPGITISTPPGSSTLPVTSVVRKKNCGRYPLKNGVCRPPSSLVSTYTSASK